MIWFAIGLFTGATLGIFFQGFASMDAYEKGYEDGFEEGKRWEQSEI